MEKDFSELSVKGRGAIANRCPDAPAGIVALAAPARPLAVLLREQLAYISQSQGGTADDVEATVGKLLGGVPPAYRHFADTYDAPGEAKGTPCPMLFVQGGHDYQVTAEDFALWKAAPGGDRGTGTIAKGAHPQPGAVSQAESG